MVPPRSRAGWCSSSWASPGSWRSRIRRSESRTFLDNLYLTLQLAVLSYGGGGGDLNWRLEVARFAAPLMAMGTLFQAASVVFREQFERYRLSSFRGHTVVCGLGCLGHQAGAVAGPGRPPCHRCRPGRARLRHLRAAGARHPGPRRRPHRPGGAPERPARARVESRRALHERRHQRRDRHGGTAGAPPAPGRRPPVLGAPRGRRADRVPARLRPRWRRDRADRVLQHARARRPCARRRAPRPPAGHDPAPGRGRAGPARPGRRCWWPRSGGPRSATDR